MILNAPLGPSVLTIVPARLGDLFLAILLLTFLMSIFLGRRKRKGEEQQVPAPSLQSVPDEVRTQPPQPMHFPWLDIALRAEVKADERPSSSTASKDLRPVLITGFGEAGQWVLTHIKNTLLDRLDAWPDCVKLLLIDFEDADHDPRRRKIHFAGRSLDEGEMVILHPQWRDVDREIEQELRDTESRWTVSDRSRLYENWHHRWWIGSQAGYHGRCGGRMAVFWDLQRREGGGELERRLRETLDSFKDMGPLEAVLVASTTDEACSGMIWDVGHLLRVLPQANRPNVVSLFLSFSPGREENNAYQVTAAVLREMDRLSYPVMTAHHYLKGTPFERSWLVSPTQTQPFDQVYLVGNKSGQGSIDLSTTLAPYGISPLVADAIVTLLDKKVGTEFGAKSLKPWMEAHTAQRASGHCKVSSVGVFTFKLPVHDLRRALEYRLLLDILFGEGSMPDPDKPTEAASHHDEAIGLLKLRRQLAYVRTTTSIWYRPLREDPVVYWAQEVESLLRGQDKFNLMRSQPLLIAMADAWRSNTWPELPDPRLWNPDVVAGARNILCHNLQQKLNLLLNGSPRAEGTLEARSVRFPDALAFLRAFRDALEGDIPPVPNRRIWPLEQDVREAYDELLSFGLQMASQAEQELKNWVQCLAPDVMLEESTSPTIGRLEIVSLSTERREAVRPHTLRQILVNGLKEARQRLEEEQNVAVRTTFLDPEKLELPFYLAHVTPGHLEQVMRQILWRWSITAGDTLTLQLMVLGPEQMNVATERWQSYAHSSQQMTNLAEDLLSLVKAVSRSVIRTISLEEAMRGARWPDRGANVAVALRDNCLHMLGVQGEEVKVNRYGAAATWPGGRAWQQGWGQAPDTIADQGPGGDKYSAAIFEALQPVDLVNTDVWLKSVGQLREEAQTTAPYSPLPQWHVLPAEQVAAECENRHSGGLDNMEGILFHPLFVRLLEDEDLAYYFALGYLCGLLQWREAEKLYYWVPDNRPLRGIVDYPLPILQAMEAFTVLVPWTEVAGEQLVNWERKRVLDALDHVIREKWQQLAEQQGSLEQMLETLQRERIDPLRQSHERLAQNLATFLDDAAVLFASEARYGT